LTDSTKTEPRILDLERDVPTTAEDVRVLQGLRKSPDKDALVHVRRLLAPGWTFASAAARPTFGDWPPFEL
jgi:hypothetical protein